ncbi:MAG: HAMP domain-containing histidine kinase [Nitrospirae bacterium]|nr:HAMP domain-containing histidine kinase [Nitrospirota bacterium]MBF0541799.1 HAMP domain-containing histidine kinase [Nitrospirota bacterium]
MQLIIKKINDYIKKSYKLSLKRQVAIVLLFPFLLAVFGLIHETSAHYLLSKRSTFIALTNEFIIKVIRSKHYEERYFLSGENLEDTLVNLTEARKMVFENYKQFTEFAGEQQVISMVTHLTRRIELFEKLSEYSTNVKKFDINDPEISAIRKQILPQGLSLEKFTKTLFDLEKESLLESINQFLRYNLYFMSLPFITLIILGLFLMQKVLKPVGILANHSIRIGNGVYVNIELNQKFRDEFHNFAEAFNNMVKTIEMRQKQSIQTHKLHAIGTLTAGVAHELNNPLNNILITSNTLTDEFDEYSREEIKEMITDIVNDSERARKIVRDLLDFSRESSSNMKSIKVSDFINETMHIVNNELSLKNIVTDLKIENNLPSIYGDDQKLKQVFINLILNAKDALSEKGHIIISASLSNESNTVIFKVTDNGTGIPKHILDHIFDPFFTTKNLSSGTGLGLSVCQGIIANHNGSMNVDSELDVGTTFTVTLPVTTIRSDHIS